MEFLLENGAGILFYVFALLAVAGAVVVVTMRNPIYSAIGLLTSFLAVAALFVLRHAEFIGVVQVFVYGGGIMVLFLFVIMLVNLQHLREVNMFVGQSPAGALVAGLFLVVLGYLVSQIEFGPAFQEPDRFRAVGDEVLGNAEAVAWILYRDFLLPFEIASLFLLVAMIGAIVLGRRA